MVRAQHRLNSCAEDCQIYETIIEGVRPHMVHSPACPSHQLSLLLSFPLPLPLFPLLSSSSLQRSPPSPATLTATGKVSFLASMWHVIGVCACVRVIVFLLVHTHPVHPVSVAMAPALRCVGEQDHRTVLRVPFVGHPVVRVRAAVPAQPITPRYARD